MTLSIMTLSITTLSITTLNTVKLSVMTGPIMLSVVVLSDVKLNVIMLSVVVPCRGLNKQLGLFCVDQKVCRPVYGSAKRFVGKTLHRPNVASAKRCVGQMELDQILRNQVKKNSTCLQRRPMYGPVPRLLVEKHFPDAIPLPGHQFTPT
jgi:hypothetical protein